MTGDVRFILRQLVRRIRAKDQLLISYRSSVPPKEVVFAELDDTRDAVELAEAWLKDTQAPSKTEDGR